MALTGNSSHQKLAEKLVILNQRAQGMLTRIYNVKKMLGTTETRPPFLNDKAFEPAIKAITKKFPAMDIKGNMAAFNAVQEKKMDILKSLNVFYFTFVDTLEFRDLASELLTLFDALQINFDISLNFDLTKGYLDLVTAYTSIMILVSRIKERQALVGLFALANELQHSHAESSFPRLGQMLSDYEFPIKKLNEEFVPHTKLLTVALVSLSQIYTRRNLSAAQWRAAQFLDILQDPSSLIQAATCETIPCEYLSLDTMEKWIILGALVIHQQLTHPQIQELWKTALSGGYVISLCRDEVLVTHAYIQSVLENFKGYSKHLAEVKEIGRSVFTVCAGFHRDRRKFMRNVLYQLTLAFTDQPGLLGPKVLLVFMALSHARDEVQWLLRHVSNIPKNKKITTDDFVDRQLPELLFYIEEMRLLMKKYGQVVQRYHVQYMKGYDAAVLQKSIQSLKSNLSEEESTILTSFYAALSSVDVRQVDSSEPYDFDGFRLDWQRLQAYMSAGSATCPILDHRSLAKHLNITVFHTKMVDHLDEVLNETSDLSVYCFYTSLLETQFRHCMEFPAQHRFSIAFTTVCSHFMTATHDLCPEEKISIGQTSLQYANWFLKEMSEEVNQVITAICEEHCKMADALLPKNCVNKMILDRRSGKSKGHKEEKKNPVKFVSPGEESMRAHREDFTRADKLHMALTELCHSLNYHPIIHVWDHGFVPREFFMSHLESRFNKALVGMMKPDMEGSLVAKPSELLNCVKAMMEVLQSLENYITIDIARIFNNVLLHQTQPTDGITGEKTLTCHYTSWYLDVLLRHVSQGHILYSPLQKAFVSLSTEDKLPFSAEEYTDLSELKALSELLGPYGMRYMGEQVMLHVQLQVKELKKLVIGNKDVLVQMRTNFDKSDAMRELFKKLTTAPSKQQSWESVDNVLQRITIIGTLLSFRSLAQDALLYTMEDRIPFLLASVRDYKDNTPVDQNSLYTHMNDMASSTGIQCNVDPLLVSALRNQKPEIGEKEYDLACLLMVFIAVSIPRLASLNSSVYKSSLKGHANNLHCIGRAVNQLAMAMFIIHGPPNDTEERLKEFLALASSSLLRLGQETDKELIRSRESVYLLLNIIVEESPILTMDLLESCFPYVLLRNAYHTVYKGAD